MSRSGVNPYGVTTEDLAYLRQMTRGMWKNDVPLTLDEATEAMRLAGATDGGGGVLKSSVLIEKLSFVISKRHSSTRKVIAGRTILRATVGSVIHGLNIAGQDDRDEMGVCIEPPEYVIGLKSFEQHVERSRPNGERSQAGDLDLVIYSLRKWVKLATSGNPTVLLLLFAPPSAWIEWDEATAQQLQGLAPAILSRRCGHAFLGYMEQQRQRLVGERGQKNVKRPELEELYGFDTKYAMHVLRLGLQGVELLSTGKLSLPMREDERSYLLGVRTGHVPLEEVLARAGELERELKDLIESSPLPFEPDRDVLDEWLTQTYRLAWTREEAMDMSGPEYVRDDLDSAGVM